MQRHGVEERDLNETMQKYAQWRGEAVDLRAD